MKKKTGNSPRSEDDIMTERGTVSFKGAVQKGESKSGKEWFRENILIEIPIKNRPPKHISLSLWGEEINDFDDINEGDNVDIKYFVEAREYQGKWFNDVKYWSVTKITETHAQTTTVTGEPQSLFDFADIDNTFSNPDWK